MLDEESSSMSQEHLIEEIFEKMWRSVFIIRHGCKFSLISQSFTVEFHTGLPYVKF